MQNDSLLDSLHIIAQGGVVSIAVAALLSAMSIGSWTLMVIKAIQARRLRTSGSIFLARFWQSAPAIVPGFGSSSKSIATKETGLSDPMDGLLAAVIKEQPKAADNPFARLGLQAANAASHYARHVVRQRLDVDRSYDDFIAHQLQRAIGQEGMRLETGLTLLASVGSIAPFVGLFGTVWGIYHALGNLAAGGQATVDKVAGPVGEALIMTAFGLAVAMPAVLAYNALIRDNRLVMEEIENFVHELHTYLTTGVPMADVQKAPAGGDHRSAGGYAAARPQTERHESLAEIPA